MPVFNSINFLPKSIDSILSQTVDDFEFIIVDDGSTQPVSELLESYDDKRIKIIKNKTNIGLTKSLNICLDAAKGDYLARMDGDDISLPNRFEEQLKLFTDDSVGFVGCWAKTINIDGNHVKGWVDKGGRGKTSNLTRKYITKNCMVDPSSIYSRKAVDKIGYYDERMYRTQTYNYNRRIQKFFKGVILDKVFYHRRVHPNSVGKAISKMKRFKGVKWNDRANKLAKKFPIIK
jgi:glycosyltransferase involved in cell wall biosynthesis